MTRWRDYTVTLPPETVEQLLNGLTLGWGYLGYAVRVLSQDGELDRVVEALRRAHAFLSRSAVLLTRRPGTEPDGQGGLPPSAPLSTPAPSPSWQQVLATRTLFERARLLALLEETVRQSRQAGQALLDDGEVATIHDHMRRSLALLDQTLDELLAPSPDAGAER